MSSVKSELIFTFELIFSNIWNSLVDKDLILCKKREQILEHQDYQSADLSVLQLIAFICFLLFLFLVNYWWNSETKAHKSVLHTTCVGRGKMQACM